MAFHHFPKETIMIFKNSRISIPTTQAFGPGNTQERGPQMEMSVFLETWKTNWGSAEAPHRCGTFMCSTCHTLA